MIKEKRIIYNILDLATEDTWNLFYLTSKEDEIDFYMPVMKDLVINDWIEIYERYDSKDENEKEVIGDEVLVSKERALELVSDKKNWLFDLNNNPFVLFFATEVGEKEYYSGKYYDFSLRIKDWGKYLYYKLIG